MIRIKTRIFFKLLLLCAVLICCLCEVAYADTSSSVITSNNILDSVMMQFKTKAYDWVEPIKIHARYLFICLATISMVWTMGQLLYHRSSFPELFGEFIRFLCFTGLFLWFLENAPTMSEDIINGFRKLAGQASGRTALSPSGVMDLGIELCSKVYNCVNFWDGVAGLGTLLLSVIIFSLLTLISINMLLQICTAWLLAYVGVFFLGFGGGKWTSDMSINYLKTVLSLGASIMTMTLIISLGEEFINTYIEGMTIFKNKNDVDGLFDELLIVFALSLTLFMLVDKLPPMVAGIVTGSSIGMSASVGGTFGAGTALGMAMSAKAMMTTSVMGGLSNAKSNISKAISERTGNAERHAQRLFGSSTNGGSGASSSSNGAFPTPSSGTPLDQ